MSGKFKKGKKMDPRVSEADVPAYKKVEEKLRQIDNTIIIARTYYLFDNLNFAYRFQLFKKDKMCMVDIPKKMLDDLKNNTGESEEEVSDLLRYHVQNSHCWADIEK
jgi:hypothetical protein